VSRRSASAAACIADATAAKAGICKLILARVNADEIAVLFDGYAATPGGGISQRNWLVTVADSRRRAGASRCLSRGANTLCQEDFRDRTRRRHAL